MTQDSQTLTADLTRPIVGIENRTAQEVFDIMSDRIKRAEPVQKMHELDVDDLAQEIRRVDGNHSLGAGVLAEALLPYLQKRGC